MSARFRTLRMERMEERKMMAADLMGGFAVMSSSPAPDAGTVETARFARATTGESSLDSLSSTGTTTPFTGPVATLGGVTINTNGVFEQSPSTTPPATVQLINGSLLIHGTPANDNVSVTRLSNATQTGYLVEVNGTAYWFDQSAVNGGDVSFYGFEGNDTFRNDASSQLRAIVFGGGGDDTITGGVMDDILDGGLGIDHIYGMAGKDYIAVGDGPGWNYAEGGAGDDKIYGGNGMDFLNGNEGRDLIYGRLGEDYLDGGAGNDLLDGGSGDYSYNYLAGGSGNDELYGGWGFDYMMGHSGNDILAGRAGNDYLHGGTGCDRLFGEDGDDTLEGGIDETSDTMYGGAGSDSFADEQFFDWLGREKHEHIKDFEPGVDKP